MHSEVDTRRQPRHEISAQGKLTPIVGNRRAFTLIELLVVIAIISLLAAILFPVFATAREKARQAACVSNEKQIGLGILQYLQDNDEAFPYTMFGFGLGSCNNGYQPFPGESYQWGDAMQPYVKSYDVFKCPDNKHNTAFPTAPEGHYQVPGGTLMPISYAVNGYSIGSNGNVYAPFADGSCPMNNGGQNRSINVAQIVSSSQLIVLTETVEPNFSWFDVAANSIGGTPTLMDCAAVNSWNRWGGCLFAGHNGRTNYLFADGHVKALYPFQTIDATAGGSSPVNMWTYNQDTITSASPGFNTFNQFGAIEALSNSYGS